MKQASKAHWAQFNEVSFVTGMRILFWVFRTFGRWPFRLFLYPVLGWYVLTQARARSASQAYLKVVANYTAQTVRLGLLGTLQHFASFAENILDKMLLWGGLYDAKEIRYFGQDQMHAQIGKREGAVIICSHFGNLDLCRVLSRRFSAVKLTILVHTKHAQAFNRMLAKLDPESQFDLLQVTEMTPATAMLLSEKISQGGFVVIAGDRIPVSSQPRIVQAKFFGQDAAFPIGPYVLASLLQCPLYMLFSMPNALIPEVHFELLRESVRLPRKGEAREQLMQELASAYAARLQHHCEQAPLQWFNFYDFWQLPQLEHSDVTHAN